jgi:hypothetical protein
MAFQVSPGVQVNEIDASGVVPAVSTSIGGFAGAFNWGPVEEVRTVGSEIELASIFGTPDSNTYKYFLTAASFLKYGNALKVVRAASGHVNATDGTAKLVKNEDHYDSLSHDGTFIAKYPGILGNAIDVKPLLHLLKQTSLTEFLELLTQLQLADTQTTNYTSLS